MAFFVIFVSFSHVIFYHFRVHFSIILSFFAGVFSIILSFFVGVFSIILSFFVGVFSIILSFFVGVSSFYYFLGCFSMYFCVIFLLYLVLVFNKIFDYFKFFLKNYV